MVKSLGRLVFIQCWCCGGGGGFLFLIGGRVLWVFGWGLFFMLFIQCGVFVVFGFHRCWFFLVVFGWHLVGIWLVGFVVFMVGFCGVVFGSSSVGLLCGF